MRHSRAIDLYIGELARRGRSPATRRTYQRLLFDFADLVDRTSEMDVGDTTPDDCRRFLDRWRDSSPSTLATGVSLLRGYFLFLEKEGHLAARTRCGTSNGRAGTSPKTSPSPPSAPVT